jgi:yecA family protein
MPIVWGGTAPEWKRANDEQEAIGLLMRMWNQVTQGIKDGSYSPLMSGGTDEDGNEAMLPHVWCMGFLEGMRVHQEYWFDDSNDALKELVLPIGMVAMDAAVMLGDAPESDERLSQEQIDQFTDLLPDVVQALHEYWRAHPVTESSPGAAIVGSALCPCGSGKSFKNCHGASLQ